MRSHKVLDRSDIVSPRRLLLHACLVGVAGLAITCLAVIPLVLWVLTLTGLGVVYQTATVACWTVGLLATALASVDHNRHQILGDKRALLCGIGAGVGFATPVLAYGTLTSLLNDPAFIAEAAAYLLGAVIVTCAVSLGRWRLLRRSGPLTIRRDLPSCPSCGYSLIGNVSMACPECGIPFSDGDVGRHQGEFRKISDQCGPPKKN